MKTRILLIIITLIISVTSLPAQRLSNNQVSIALQAGTYSSNILGTYTLSSDIYKGNGRILLQANYHTNNVELRINTYTLSAGYSHNIFRNYHRTHILSAGAVAVAGYETIDASSLLDGQVLSIKDNTFIYGIAPVITYDFFFSQNLALTLSARENIYINSSIASYHFISQIGLKYLL